MDGSLLGIRWSITFLDGKWIAVLKKDDSEVIIDTGTMYISRPIIISKKNITGTCKGEDISLYQQMNNIESIITYKDNKFYANNEEMKNKTFNLIAIDFDKNIVFGVVKGE